MQEKKIFQLRIRQTVDCKRDKPKYRFDKLLPVFQLAFIEYLVDDALHAAFQSQRAEGAAALPLGDDSYRQPEIQSSRLDLQAELTKCQ